MKNLVCFVAFLLLSSCSVSEDNANSIKPVEADGSEGIQGIVLQDYRLEEHVVKRGDYFGSIMEKNGVDANTVLRLVEVSKEVFDVRKIQLGKGYGILYEKEFQGAADTVGKKGKPAFFVYELDNVSSLFLSLQDSLYAFRYEKPIVPVRKTAEVTVRGSLWNDVKDAGIPAIMALRLSDIYDCTIDFFGLQKGDAFRVMYDELTHKGQYMGLGDIYYAEFTSGGRTYRAIRFQDGEKGSRYWNEKGESMKKAFLKAPLNFTRISSRFTYARRHPVLKIVRPHTGVDYAAPAGTPVVALGDGVVTHKGWAGGGGNTIKIRHNSTYVTSYMHLRGYAKGLSKGKRVKQGEVIGYVGSTGLSTGPHLDFRVYKHGTPIDPLKMESPSIEPVSKENMPAFTRTYETFSRQADSIDSYVYLRKYLEILQ